MSVLRLVRRSEGAHGDGDAHEAEQQRRAAADAVDEQRGEQIAHGEERHRAQAVGEVALGRRARSAVLHVDLLGVGGEHRATGELARQVERDAAGAAAEGWEVRWKVRWKVRWEARWEELR